MIQGWFIVIGSVVIAFGVVCLILYKASKTIDDAERNRSEGE